MEPGPAPRADALPPELLATCFAFVGRGALARCSAVCRAWRDACREPSLYRRVTIAQPGAHCFTHCDCALCTEERRVRAVLLSGSDLVSPEAGAGGDPDVPCPSGRCQFSYRLALARCLRLSAGGLVELRLHNLGRVSDACLSPLATSHALRLLALTCMRGLTAACLAHLPPSLVTLRVLSCTALETATWEGETQPSAELLRLQASRPSLDLRACLSCDASFARAKLACHCHECGRAGCVACLYAGGTSTSISERREDDGGDGGGGFAAAIVSDCDLCSWCGFPLPLREHAPPTPTPTRPPARSSMRMLALQRKLAMIAGLIHKM